MCVHDVEHRLFGTSVPVCGVGGLPKEMDYALVPRLQHGRNRLVERPACHAFGTFMSFCTLDLKLQLQEKCVPVSRTRTPKKNRNNLAPKSKEAQRKIRRWSFVVEVTVGDTTKTFQPPALTIGNLGSARAAAETIRADMPRSTSSRMQGGCQAQAEETVSLTILNQINGLNEQSRLLTFALKRAVTDVVKLDTPAVPATRSRRSCTSGRVRPPCHGTPRQVRDGEQQAMRRQQMIDAGIDPDQMLNNQLPAEQVRLSSKQRQLSKKLQPNRSTQILFPTGSS